MDIHETRACKQPYHTEMKIMVSANSVAELEDKIHDIRMIYDDQYNKLATVELAKTLNLYSVTTSDYEICGTSLVGIIGECPVSHGNYFSMNINGDRNIPVINIWHENFIEAINRFDITEFDFTIIENGKAVIVKSPKIPSEWYLDQYFIEYNCSLNYFEKFKVRKYCRN